MPRGNQIDQQTLNIHIVIIADIDECAFPHPPGDWFDGGVVGVQPGLGGLGDQCRVPRSGTQGGGAGGRGETAAEAAGHAEHRARETSQTRRYRQEGVCGGDGWMNPPGCSSSLCWFHGVT